MLDFPLRAFVGTGGLIRDYSVRPNFVLHLGVTVQFAEAEPCIALLDTGAAWSVVTTEFIGEPEPGEGLDASISTRFGSIPGRLVRRRVRLLADKGRALDVDATILVVDAEDWPGPPVIGFGGCLERVRFAIEPAIHHADRGRWYFDQISDET